MEADCKTTWRKKWQHTLVFLPEKSHGQRSLVGYSLWGHKESDTAEQLHSLTSLKFYKDAALIGFLIEMPVKIEF